jgi:hypothetical protein
MKRLFLILAVLCFASCGDGLTTPTNPADSTVRHAVAINGSTQVIRPAVDGEYLVNVVRGADLYVKAGEVVSVRCYTKPNWAHSEVTFNPVGSITLAGPVHTSGATWSYVMKDGSEAWINLDHADVTVQGGAATRTIDNLMAW